jgi:hypothetical protein
MCFKLSLHIGIGKPTVHETPLGSERLDWRTREATE